MAAAGDRQRDAGQHAMAAAGQQPHAGAQRRLILDLGQDAPADRDDRIGREHERVRLLRGDRLRLLARQPQRMLARQLALAARSRRCRQGPTASGSTPMRASRSRRRGLAEARTSRIVSPGSRAGLRGRA